LALHIAAEERRPAPHIPPAFTAMPLGPESVQASSTPAPTPNKPKTLPCAFDLSFSKSQHPADLPFLDPVIQPLRYKRKSSFPSRWKLPKLTIRAVEFTIVDQSPAGSVSFSGFAKTSFTLPAREIEPYNQLRQSALQME
jgi:hypothetical protein